MTQCIWLWQRPQSVGDYFDSITTLFSAFSRFTPTTSIIKLPWLWGVIWHQASNNVSKHSFHHGDLKQCLIWADVWKMTSFSMLKEGVRINRVGQFVRNQALLLWFRRQFSDEWHCCGAHAKSDDPSNNTIIWGQELIVRSSWLGGGEVGLFRGEENLSYGSKTLSVM